ncbi:hypothetical protein LCGC14_0281960 [marine sediment metagenome]|jgi:hypothetical protein|uniref:Uncharacterized protein n=1 Tax=marine sediment metagenome TaxID=412755 RepID=A0A0F9UCB4_9ZZZZ
MHHDEAQLETLTALQLRANLVGSTGRRPVDVFPYLIFTQL